MTMGGLNFDSKQKHWDQHVNQAIPIPRALFWWTFAQDCPKDDKFKFQISSVAMCLVDVCVLIVTLKDTYSRRNKHKYT